MHTRNFGNENEVKVSEIGLGAWQLGGDWGSVTDDVAAQILASAEAQGISFIDTADVYGAGLSERRIGKFLKGKRDRFFIATKLGRGGDPGWPENFTRTAIRAHTEASLQRLEVDSVDLTQLHCIPFEELQKGECFEHLRELKKEGKIRRFGASVESMEEALHCVKQDGLSSLQIIFNIFRQKPIATLFNEAKERGVALIIRLPLASGLLTGKFTKASTFAAEDHRNYNRDGQMFNVGETFAGLPFELGVELADELKSLVPDGMTFAEFSIRWILDFDAVSVVIPGAKSPAQVADNARASDLPSLPPELHEKLKAFYATRVAEHIRGPY